MADVKKINDGGPAFPVELQLNNGIPAGGVQTSGYSGWATGMSIRDWFAGQALAGEFAAQNEITGEIANSTPDEWMLDRAKVLYRMADAMIAARKAGA